MIMFSKSAKADITNYIDQFKLSVVIIITESLLHGKILPEYTTSCSTAENLYVEEYHSLSQLTSESVPTESATKEKSHLLF